jgi:hypothetical protein
MDITLQCVTGYSWSIGWSGFDSRWRLGIFLFNILFRPPLVSTHPPTQWLPGTFSPGVKRQKREADYSPPSNADDEECVELYLHFPICLHAVLLSWAQGQLYLYLCRVLVKFAVGISLLMNILYFQRTDKIYRKSSLDQVFTFAWVLDFILHVPHVLDACALASILPLLSLTHMMYCTPEKKPTPASASTCGLKWISFLPIVVKRFRNSTARVRCFR